MLSMTTGIHISFLLFRCGQISKVIGQAFAPLFYYVLFPDGVKKSTPAAAGAKLVKKLDAISKYRLACSRAPAKGIE